MSYLLESLGRGLLNRILDAFETHLPAPPDETAEELAARRRMSPTSYDLAMRLGAKQLRNMRLREAEATLRAAQELHRDRPQPLIGLACVCDERGDIDAALGWLDQAAALDPRDPAVQYSIGMCHERLGNPQAADASYNRAKELCDVLRNAHERSAALAIVRQDWRAAAECYATLANLAPDDLDVLLTLATLHLLDGDAESAVDFYQRALLIEPDSYDEPTRRTGEIEDDQALREAIDTFERLVEQHPGMVEFHVHLGDLYAKSDEDAAAIEQYQLALEYHPTLLEATVKIGTQHLRRGRYDPAAHAFNRAVELNDRLLIAFVGLGVAQQFSGRGADALATFDLAAGLAPNSTLLLSESTRLRVKALQRHRRTESSAIVETVAANGADEHLSYALQQHERCIRSHPHDAELHYRYAILARHVGNFGGSLTALREATQINPTYGKALIMLGVALREAGDGYGSVAAFRRAILPDLDAIDLHYRVALSFSRRTQFEIALVESEDALDCDPAFHNTLGLALQTVGMVDRTAASWNSTCALIDEPPCFGGTRRFTSPSIN